MNHNALKALLKAVAETVRYAKQAPSGVIYAGLMGMGVTIDQYQAIEAALINVLKVRKSGDVLYWTDDSEAIFHEAKEGK